MDARCKEYGSAKCDQFADLLNKTEVFCFWRLVERVVFLQDFGGFDEIRTFVAGRG